MRLTTGSQRQFASPTCKRGGNRERRSFVEADHPQKWAVMRMKEDEEVAVMRMEAGDEALRSRWIHHFHNPYKPSFNIKSGKEKSTVTLLLRRKIDRFNMIHHERSWMNRKSMHAKMCYNLPSVSNSACMVRQNVSFELFRTQPLCSENIMVSWNYTLFSETTFVHTRKSQKKRAGFMCCPSKPGSARSWQT